MGHDCNYYRACLEHRGRSACAQDLTTFNANRAAGIDRSFKFINCTFVPGEIRFLLESEADAIKMIPIKRERWEC